MDMNHAELSSNNLGGLGPSSGPAEIRYSHIGENNRRPFDLIITNISEYHSVRPEKNGLRASGELGSINVAGPTTVELWAQFVRSGTSIPMVLDKFYWVSLNGAQSFLAPPNHAIVLLSRRPSLTLTRVLVVVKR